MSSMNHLVLLGDSIFDNERYVAGQMPVAEHLRNVLPADWVVSLLAADGSCTRDVLRQLPLAPETATHLLLSAGGNDALESSGLLSMPVSNAAHALALVEERLERFRADYTELLAALFSTNIPFAVCSIYDSIPLLGRAERNALRGFNDIILRTALAHALPVIDLRLVCSEKAHYSAISPVEPSYEGGRQIALAIKRMLWASDFGASHSTIYF